MGRMARPRDLIIVRRGITHHDARSECPPERAHAPLRFGLPGIGDDAGRVLEQIGARVFDATLVTSGHGMRAHVANAAR